MTLPVVERIAQAIKAQLETIQAGQTNSKGYTYLHTPGQVVRPARMDRVTYSDLDIAIDQAERALVPTLCQQGNPPSVAWRHRFVIRAIRTPADSSTESIDAAINLFQADIDAALMEDAQWGGLAINTEPGESDPVLSVQGDKVGVDVSIYIIYAHDENNPTNLRS